MGLFALSFLTGAFAADDADPSPPTATQVAKNINSRIFSRLLLHRRGLLVELEAGSEALKDGTVLYKLKLDPELAAHEVAVFKRDGELLSGSAGTLNRLPTAVHKSLDMSNGLGFLLTPTPGVYGQPRYQLFYPLTSSASASANDWTWVLYIDIDIDRALPAILEKLRLLRSDNVLLYADPDHVLFSFREDGIDFSESQSFGSKRNAVHALTLTDLLRSDSTGEKRLTFLKQSPPQMVDTVVSWDKNEGVLGEPWIVVHSAKAYDGGGERGRLTGEWLSVGAEGNPTGVMMAILTESSNFKMILEQPSMVLLAEGRFLEHSITAHTVKTPGSAAQVLSLSGSYSQEADQITFRMVVKDGEKLKVSKYLFARSGKRFYKESKADQPQIKLRAFN